MATSFLTGAILKSVIGAITANLPGIEPAKLDRIARDATEAVTADPVVKNETNQEPLSQSRVVWGTSIAALASAVAVIVGQIEAREFNPETAMPAIVALGGALYGLYGRVARGLKPLFSRK